jgi:Tfp pilus assembly protein PilF
MSTVAGVTEQPDVRAHTASAKALPINESLLIGGVLAVTAMVYATVLGFPFVYDDDGQIVQNITVQSWRYVPWYFKSQVWQYLYPDAPGNFYRPLNLLWFRLNDALFGLNPAWWHLTTVLLHLLCTYLVYVLARRLTARPLVAAGTALIFGVHPMRHGVVAWVSGSTESLSAAFFLVAFLAYLVSREGHRFRWMSVSCGFYAMALFSKETTIMLPMVVFAHGLIYGAGTPDSIPAEESFWQSLAKTFQIALVYVPLAVAYLIARTVVLRGFSHNLVELSPRDLVLTIPSIAWFYVRQWLFPIRLMEFYNLEVQTRVNLAHVVVPVLCLLALAAVLTWSSKKLGSRETTFAVIWMAVLLLPTFDLGVFPAGDLVHDRYFYVPSFGAALLVGLALNKLASGPLVFGMQQKWLLTVAALAVLLSYSAANAASYWIDDYILFEHAYLYTPENTVVRNNYAIELARHWRFPEASAILRKLLQEQPNNLSANYNYAGLRYQFHALPEAEKYFTRATQIDPGSPDSYMHLAVIELDTGRPAQAEAHIRFALSIRPIQPSYHFALGVVLAQRGDCTGARAEFAAALALKPDMVKAKEQSAACKEADAAPPANSQK